MNCYKYGLQPIMTCHIHNLKEVANHYGEDGQPDVESFSSGEWRIEKKCVKCGSVINNQLNLIEE